MTIARLSEKKIRKEDIRDLDEREKRKDTIRKNYEERAIEYKELLIGKEKIDAELKGSKSKTLKNKILKQNLEPLGFKENNSYYELLELLYEEGDTIRSLLKDSIENIPQENDRIKDKNFNKNSNKVQNLTERLEEKVDKEIQSKLLGNMGYVNLTHVIIQIYYDFLEENKYNPKKIEDHFDRELNKLKQFNKFLNEYEYRVEENHFLLLYMKMKQLEIKNKLAEEMNINNDLRKEYTEKCIITSYPDMDEGINLENLKGIDIGKVAEIVYGSEKVTNANKKKIKDFMEIKYENGYTKLQNIFRIKESYPFPNKNISDIDGNLDICFFELIGALKEFVYLEKGAYLPLNLKKGKNSVNEKSDWDILRNFGRDKISEAYDYYIFLRLVRGLHREKGTSRYFSQFHEIDVAYNNLFLNALNILNVKKQSNRLEKLDFGLCQDFYRGLGIDLKKEFLNRLGPFMD